VLTKLEPTRDDAPLDYLYWLMRTPQYRTHCRAHATGTTNLGLAREDFLAFPAPEPTETQHLIVDALGALDDKIELNRKMNRTLEDMAQAIFQSWFAGLDDRAGIIRHVQEIVDAGILEIGDGYRAKRSELDEEGMPFARAGNIDGGFQFEGAELLGAEGIEAARVQRKLSQPLDVVFTSKGTVGRFAFVTDDIPDFVYSPQLCFWRSLRPEKLNPYFLFYWMKSPAFLRQVAAVKGQTDMADYVSLRDQRRMKMVVPSPRDQAVLVEGLKPLVDRAAHNVEESRTLAELRDALLPRLISGELRVPAAERVVEQAL
jgi:type I restriction enzyme S subunit